MKIKAVIFDLDYTLYDENLYYFKVLEEMGQRLILSEKKVIKMKEIFFAIKGKSKDVFGDILKELNMYSPELQEKFFETYKTLKCNIPLYTDAKKLIYYCKKENIRLGIITNGVIEAQKSKIKSLNIENIFDFIIFARQWGKEFEKPHKKPFKEAINKLEINPEQAIYVGDNPHIDFKGAKEVGMKTVRILRGPFKKELSNIYIDTEVKSLLEVKKMIENQIKGEK